MEKKTITVSLETWKALTELKIDKNIRTLDGVIKWLLKKNGGKKNGSN